MEITANKAAALYQGISNMGGQALAVPPLDQSAPPSVNFAQMIGDAMERAVGVVRNSEQVSAAAVAGKASLTDLVTAISSAELTLNTVVAIRDRVIGAYQDIIKMPI